ncbi:MAG TPA: RloB family protein [Candidatus Cloacimonadota bacterium]|nr:RloB family protein [Candidatus Cloacimonadota bacterium]
MPPSRYARKSGCRIPRKFYIAPEGSKTEYNYFQDIQLKLRLENVEIIPVPRESGDTQSNPEHIVDIAASYCNEEKIKVSKNVHVAIIIDFDRWREKIVKAFQDARQMRFDFYVSNPCIELWFCLHSNEFVLPERVQTLCSYYKQQFGNLFNGHYDALYPLTKNAIRNAKQIDSDTDADWPITVGTNLYKLFDLIMQKCKDEE